MQRKQLAVLFAASVVGVAALLGVAFSRQHSSGVGACARPGHSHQLSIRSGVLSRPHVAGQLCDRLTITNLDNTTRDIAFGQHDNHQAYDGITERLLGKGDSLTITLVQKGTYELHDHFHDGISGTFTVQ